MVHIPVIQSSIGDAIASAISKKLGTPVSVGRVDIGFLNRIIIDNVDILDQRGKQMLWASRLSAKFNYTDLLRGKVSITSAQIFTPKFNLYKQTAKAKPNFQFVIDSLASKDTTKSNPVNISINSLIIRHGEVAWNQFDAPKKNSFDTKHLDIKDISSHIIINSIFGDSINVNIKKLSLKEASGLAINSLSLKAVGNKKRYDVVDLKLALPHSEIFIPQADIRKTNGKTGFDCNLAESHFLMSDLSPFVPFFKGLNRQAIIRMKMSGYDNLVDINSLNVSIPVRPTNISLSSPSDIRLIADGIVNLGLSSPSWNVNVRRLSVTNDGMKIFANKIPDAVTRLNNLIFQGRVSGYSKALALKGRLMSGAGNADINVVKADENIKGHFATKSFDIAQVLNDSHFGILAADISANGNLKTKSFAGKGNIERFDYNGYSYSNIFVDSKYFNGNVDGKLRINDANLTASINGSASLTGQNKIVNLTANVDNVAPARLNLFKGRLANTNYKANIDADFKGSNLNNAIGHVAIHNFNMKNSEGNFALDSLRIDAGQATHAHYLTLRSDFGKAVFYGTFDYAKAPQLIVNAIVKRLPGIVNLVNLKYHPLKTGNISFAADIYDGQWAKAFFNVPLEVRDTIRMSADFGKDYSINADVDAPDVVYGDRHLKNVRTKIRTINDSLSLSAGLRNMRSEYLGTDLAINAQANNDYLKTDISIDNHAKEQRLYGNIKTGVRFDKNEKHQSRALLYLQKSQIHVGDTTFTIHPAYASYSKNRLEIDQLAINSNSQSVVLDGVATAESTDSLIAKLHHVDVGYIMNLVNFHSVDFDGYVSGTASVSQLFRRPQAHGSLTVDDFKLIKGRLGTLHALANWDPDEGQINIDAVAVDTIRSDGKIKPRNVVVKGYVSPKRNYIDLDLGLKDTRAEFLETLCSSFLDNVNLSANGDLRLWGDLKKINLTGDIVAYGNAKIIPLGTTYTFRHAPVHFIENDIQFHKDSIYDDHGNLGLVSGGIHHQHLSRLTYDIDIDAQNLLALNLDGSDGSSFYGKVYGTGKATITGRPGRVDVNVNMTPNRGSEIVYDITSPEALSSQEFIHWKSRDSLENKNDSIKLNLPESDIDLPSDIRLTLQIHATPDANLRLIMDKSTGDYITLNGTGDLRATYFNKGGVNIFGTYTIDHGIYSLTIQNIIKKTFDFAEGGTIVFGGDPYAAQLRLKAQYPIASVSLSDLQLGRSFSSNNIRVICLMDISGTPASPKVDFNLDFPTMSSDAKQMIYSLMNGEEEMNQQVLYLLAVGRFYSRGANNANSQSNQTSLAMQSILSGQLSQQINNILGNVVKSSNWNFGANISTGDEGFNNAQYEGLLSGHLLNNRLLFNSQFGYRDNANATSSFIGDFDVRYLIVPNGNFSIHVYNRANDRYFTRNSLNTQGLGIILKKDFGSLWEMFGKKKKK